MKMHFTHITFFFFLMTPTLAFPYNNETNRDMRQEAEAHMDMFPNSDKEGFMDQFKDNIVVEDSGVVNENVPTNGDDENTEKDGSTTDPNIVN